MKRSFAGFFLMIAALVLSAVWIFQKCIQNPEVSMQDIWPLLLAAPFFVWWTGGPWAIQKKRVPPSPLPFALAAISCCFGVLLDLVLPLALAWCLLTISFLSHHTRSGVPMYRHGLILLGLFPWILTDFSEVGLYFRLSAAHVTANFFHFLGLSVHGEGTGLRVENLMISVEPSCSGLRLLQLVLLVGSAMAVHHRLSRSVFWLAICLLPILAWCANTLRIFVTSVVGITFGENVAAGSFHTWGGLLVLVFMFLLTTTLINSLKAPFLNPSHDVNGQ